MARLDMKPDIVNLRLFVITRAVIPDKPRSGAAPESIIGHRRALRWIPGLRFACPE
ncbi:hypothetical protein [Bosea sp. AAP35]|uniref:hypothetical protein n=1 Tax=Bosea sp. AAP35 TaxID=1523417 RepID=UPI000AB829E9|nr:hypothetical protein [Bosea sp. AAP35]